MLALPGDSYSTKPGDIAVVIAALIHLHFLRVLGLGARLGGIEATRESAVQAFLALPMLLLEMGEELGYPLAMTDENARFNQHIHRRWLEYMEHLDEFISAKLNANLRKLLLPLIFQTSPS